MDAYIKTIAGVHKTESEDCVVANSVMIAEAFAQITDLRDIIAVADGVGGHLGGKTAAGQVCKSLGGVSVVSEELFARINKDLIALGNSDPNLTDMATTLSGISLSDDGNAQLFHVGNTRIYRINAFKYLEQLTQDDTVVEYLVRSGKLTDEEALSYHGRNEITACFGGGNESLLHLTLKNIEKHDESKYLLTSDGVHEYLSIDDMEDIFEDHLGNWAEIVRQLVEKAVNNGSPDDCTAVIIA